MKFVHSSICRNVDSFFQQMAQRDFFTKAIQTPHLLWWCDKRADEHFYCHTLHAGICQRFFNTNQQ